MGEQTSIEFDLTYSQRVTQMEIMILNNNKNYLPKIILQWFNFICIVWRERVIVNYIAWA